LPFYSVKPVLPVLACGQQIAGFVLLCPNHVQFSDRKCAISITGVQAALKSVFDFFMSFWDWEIIKNI